MKWSSFVKFLVGLLLAGMILAAIALYVFRYLGQITALPPRPTFSNDPPSASQKQTIAPKPAPKPATKPSPTPSPKPASSPSPSPKTRGYVARIVLAEGLNLREGPSTDATRIGGVAYNERVVVLEESSDGEWQRIQLEGSGLEGWIKSGFSERVTE